MRLELPRYELGDEVATRKAYGEALAALGSARGDVVALDGEVSNSTYAEIFAKAHPDRYFEMYIAEQQLVAAAVGLQVRGWVPFASPFADGARGPGHDARRPRFDRAVPERREPDGEARRGDGRPRGNRLHAHDPGRDAGRLRRGRGVPGRRLPRAARG